MEEGEKKPDAGTLSGDPQKKIVYAVIVVAVVILAVVLVAKFGYNTDLLNPAGGQMSLVQRPPITLVRPDVTITEQQPRLVVTTPVFHRVTTDIPRLSSCKTDQTDCNGTCVYLMTDRKNCGTCGFSCSDGFSCINGNCITDPCNGVLCPAESYCCDGHCISNATPNCGK